MLKSPQANLFSQLMARIKSNATSIRFIDHDLGQLENYEIRPSVSWPACLIDIDQVNFTDIGTDNNQAAEVTVGFRLALVKYTDSNNLTPDNVFENSLQYYEVEQQLYEALQGWNPTGFSKMLRRIAVTEKRNDDIRVRILKFVTSYTDATAAKATTSIARPTVTIGKPDITKP